MSDDSETAREERTQGEVSSRAPEKSPPWTSFVLRHSALIRRAVRRVLRDPEDAENAYVEVLAKLESGALEQLVPGTSETSWLLVLSTRVAIDHLRARYGRMQWPRALEELGPIERRVFELCHREGMDYRQTLERFRAEGTSIGIEELAQAVHRIEALLTPHVRRQLSQYQRRDELCRPEWRLLAALDVLREEARERSERSSPELELLQREAHARAERLERAREKLSESDRELLRRYYDDGISAVEIASEMGFDGPRSVHVALERLRRTLRREIESSEIRENVRDPLQ